MKYIKCTNCNKPFSNENTYSKEGWKETQISGMCEKCFDSLFEEVEDIDKWDEDFEAPPF